MDEEKTGPPFWVCAGPAAASAPLLLLGRSPDLGQDLYPSWCCDLGEAPNLCPGFAFLGRAASGGHP